MSELPTVFQAAEGCDVALLQQLIAADPSLVAERNNLDARRPTALHVASRTGHASVVKLLLRLGADPNALDSEHTSALGIAAVFGHAAVVSELATARAHTSIRNKFGFTPLAAALAGEQGRWRKYSSAPVESWQAISRALRAKGAEL